MTNGPGSGPGGGPMPSSLMPARRSSYASIVSGANQQVQGQQTRPGTFSHIQQSPSSSYPPQYQLQRPYSTGQEPDQPNSPHRKLTQLPSYSRQFARLPGYAMNGHGLSSEFFIPSYLRRSRYVAKLEAADKAKKAAERERPQSSHPGSLSRSASNASLPRMVPGTHRGMAYEIVERTPTGEQEHLMPLPSKWSDVEKNPGLDLLADGSEVRYNGPSSKTEMDAAAVRADYPMSPQCGIYYYEVEIKSKSKEGMIAVGFSNRKAALDRLPGWENDSWAYHGDDGKIFYGESTGKAYGQTFTSGDIIGCGVNFWTSSSFFTKNGQELGTAFRELKNVRPFPSVGMKKHTGTWIGANFGQRPFVFDIDGMMTRERLKVEREIQTTKVAHLRPRLSDHAPVNVRLKPVNAIQEEESEGRLIQELIAQLLAHDGYVETAKAFTTEVKEQAVPLEPKNDPMEDLEVEEDHDAVNRQNIRRSILDGDIDRALKHTHAYYPHVLERNPPIVFRLKCRKFVELIRRYSDLQNLPTQNSSKSTNGHADFGDGEVFEQDMEVDDNVSEEAKWGDSMDTESQGSGMKSEQLLQEAMEYGQVLMQEYREESNEYKKRLEEVFSLIAYHDARNSIHGHLLDPKGRVAVAEELNSAILVSLGRPSFAALEKLYQQTEALINEASQDGGPAAFVNVQNIFSS